MTKESRLPYLIATIIALTLAISAGVYKYTVSSRPQLPPVVPEVGKVGSDHAHASLLIMLGDTSANFCKPEFMLKSQYVHFENSNCTVVHRHAKGITIPTFLKTIGVGLTKECITIPLDKTYCDNGTNHLRAVINGKEMPIELLPYYVFRNNDHVLINFGPETGDFLTFKYNQVPQIPPEVNKPEVATPFGKVLEEPKLENVKTVQ